MSVKDERPGPAGEEPEGEGGEGSAPGPAAVRKAVIASAMGNRIEWFDFGVFSAGVITSIVGTVFLPPDEGGSATLRSFALIAAAFLARPFLAVIGSTFPAMFPTRVRYGAFAIGYNISTSLFGGTCAVLVGSLIAVTGSNFVPAYYLMLAALVALGPLIVIPETAGVPIERAGEEHAPEPVGAGARGA